jgi:hypothetical protein
VRTSARLLWAILPGWVWGSPIAGQVPWESDVTQSGEKWSLQLLGDLFVPRRAAEHGAWTV